MRLDFIFSYWIFFWYLLYISGLVDQYNPKFAIICGLIENGVILLLMMVFRTNLKIILLFVAMMIPLKIIPLYTLWNTKMQWSDIYFTFALFFAYSVWSYINGKKLDYFIENTRNLILQNKNTLPGMKLLDKIIVS